ncbi:MAG: hypothetical protein JRI68_19745 [Deltaproteobacteria bacterium]|nr:hypothetical protein [Deltaproteobacteria bacterium]
MDLPRSQARRSFGSPRAVRLIVVGALLVGCSTPIGCASEELNPVPQTTTSSSGAGGAPVPPAYRRTVAKRNPLGGRVGNLMVDGDFEHSIIREGSGAQIGWLAFNGDGMFTYLRGETGGLCRTGLRCGILQSSHSFWGKGTSASEGGMIGEVWAKPPAGRPCGVVTPSLIYCTLSGFQTTMPPVQDEPDGDGWCQYRVAVTGASRRMCMWIDGLLNPGEQALIDSVALVPADGTAPVRSPEPMAPDRLARARAAERWVRDRLPFGRPPPVEPVLGPK